MASVVFGLYLGATSASIAVYKEGHAEVLANDLGDRVTPAAFAYKDGEFLVGLSSLQQVIQHPTKVICNAKLEVTGGFLTDDDKLGCGVQGTCQASRENNSIVYKIQDENSGMKVFTLHQVLTHIFKKLLETARSHTGDIVSHNAVLSVPCHFNQSQREIYNKAASSAGFKVLQIINEPTAAILAWENELENQDKEQKLLIVRIGGSTMDSTVAVAKDGLYSLLANSVGKGIGGHLITNLLVEHFATEARKQFGADACTNVRSRTKLRNAAEITKRVLSTLSTSQCLVESLHDGMDYSGTLTRARLESLLVNMLPRFLDPITDSLKKCNLEASSIDTIILCGGSCRIPRVREVMQQHFPSAKILCNATPDETICVGSSIQASILRKEVNLNSDIVPLRMLTNGIYYKSFIDSDEKNSKLHLVFPPGPCIKNYKDVHLSLRSGQTAAVLEVYEALDPEDSKNVKLIAKVVLRDLEGGAKLCAGFKITSGHSLLVSLTESEKKRTEILINKGDQKGPITET